MVTENDVVLIYFEDNPLTFARIEKISPDIKKDWYHTKLLLLQVPVQAVTWILRDAYINGEEFTMDGKRMRMEKVVCPEDPEESATLEEAINKRDLKSRGEGSAKVISLTDLKKK
ncbi:hypothetical protein ACFL6B_01675 [Thermodesulfobacteriota bacterium]